MLLTLCQSLMFIRKLGTLCFFLLVCMYVCSLSLSASQISAFKKYVSEQNNLNHKHLPYPCHDLHLSPRICVGYISISGILSEKKMWNMYILWKYMHHTGFFILPLKIKSATNYLTLSIPLNFLEAMTFTVPCLALPSYSSAVAGLCCYNRVCLHISSVTVKLIYSIRSRNTESL